MRKYLYLLIVITVSAISCKREANDNCEGDLTFTSATISASSSVANGILFDTGITGGNLCYSFSRFIIEKTADKVYDIHAYGKIPCDRQICAQAIYYATPSGKIENLTAGTYTVRFLINKAIFTTITVTIN